METNWTPVEEGLPEVPTGKWGSEVVHITYAGRYTRNPHKGGEDFTSFAPRTALGQIAETGRWVFIYAPGGEGMGRPHVVAWQSLPEPYRAEVEA